MPRNRSLATSETRSNRVPSLDYILGTEVGPQGAIGPQPILDWITVACEVYRSEDGAPIPAGELFGSRFRRIRSEVDLDTGEVVSETGKTSISNERGDSFQVAVSKKKLYLSGNPTKWLQGHAAFCCLRPQSVATTVIRDLIGRITVEGYTLVPTHMSTVHLAHMFAAPTCEDARDYLHALQYCTVKARTDREVDEYGVYFGKCSKKRTLKAYLDALKFAYGMRCPSYMGRMIRVEDVLRGEPLKELCGDTGPCWFHRFNQLDLQEVFWRQILQLRYSAGSYEVEEDAEGLSLAEFGALVLWRQNRLRITPQKFRTVRTGILRKKGIDIRVPPSPAQLAETVRIRPLARFFEECCVTNHDHREAVILAYQERLAA